jgi:iron(III) transport system permease protein
MAHSVGRFLQPVHSYIKACLIVGLFTLFVLGPILILAWKTAQTVFSVHPEWLSLVVPNGRRLGLLLTSLGLAAGTAVMAMLLGWLAAVWLWSRGGRFTWLVVIFALPVLALPIFIYNLAWFAGAEGLTRLLDLLGLLMGTPTGWLSVLVVETTASIPVAFVFACLGLYSLDPELIDTARLARPDLDGLLKVVLPLCAPALWCGWAIIFLTSLLDYSVPSLLQVQVYPMEIFADFSASHRPERALLLSIPLIVTACLVLIPLLKPLRSLIVGAAFYRSVWMTPAYWPTWFRKLLKFATILALLSVCLPAIFIVMRLEGINQVFNIWQDAGSEVGVSLRLAGFSALISFPLAILVAASLLAPGRFTLIVWLIVIAPLSIPSSLAGIGLVYLTQSIALDTQFLGLWPAMMACLTRFAPFAVLIFSAQLRRRDTLQIDAARVLQKSTWRRLFWVQLPQILPGALLAAGLVFALSLGELGATLLVIPPGQTTVSLRLYNYLHYGATDVVAGLGLFLMAAVLGMGVLVVAVAWVGWITIGAQGARG